MTHYEESLAILRPLNQPGLLTDSLVVSGVIMHLYGDIDRSLSLVNEGLSGSQAVQDDWFAAYAIFNLGYLGSLTGSYASGYQQMLVGLELWRKLGDPSCIALGLNHTRIH